MKKCSAAIFRVKETKENEDTTILRNVHDCLPLKTVQQTTKFESSATSR